MNMDKYELERTFEEHKEFHGRDEKGLVKEKIFRGMFETTLTNLHGYSKKELSKAVNNGWLKRTYINPDGKGIRNAFLWVEEEMPQRGWKSWFDRIYRWFTGDYQRYYGKAK